MVKELNLGSMEVNMKGNGTKIKCKGKVNINIQMGMFILENFTIVEQMDMVHIIRNLENTTKVIGFKISPMVRVNKFSKMDLYTKVIS